MTKHYKADTLDTLVQILQETREDLKLALWLLAEKSQEKPAPRVYTKDSPEPPARVTALVETNPHGHIKYLLRNPLGGWNWSSDLERSLEGRRVGQSWQAQVYYADSKLIEVHP